MINHWVPGVRHFLFDGALARQQPVGDMIDVLMTHFTMTVSPSWSSHQTDIVHSVGFDPRVIISRRISSPRCNDQRPAAPNTILVVLFSN